MLRAYYELTKPGIVYGNALTTVAGFFLASHASLNWTIFAAALVGESLVVASSCAFNNVIDRDLDAKMERTKRRPVVRGAVSSTAALWYAGGLGLAGLSILFLFANPLSSAVALFGMFAYVCLYSLWSKRYTLHATTIGAISGAIPPVIGYSAVSGTLDAGALVLFLALCAWQMPHALAIAFYRIDDYAAAGIPVLPLKIGALRTKLLMTVYVGVFALASVALYFLKLADLGCAIALSLVSLCWLALSLQGFRMRDDRRWGKRMFLYSLIAILAFSLAASIGSLW
jgi:protoheme IX farnesyltransferase